MLVINKILRHTLFTSTTQIWKEGLCHDKKKEWNFFKTYAQFFFVDQLIRDHTPFHEKFTCNLILKHTLKTEGNYLGLLSISFVWHNLKYTYHNNLKGQKSLSHATELRSYVVPPFTVGALTYIWELEKFISSKCTPT